MAISRNIDERYVVTENSEPLTRREARAEASALTLPSHPAATESDATAELTDEHPVIDPAQAAKAKRIERIVRTVMMFLMPLIMVGMMITGYLGTMHSPSPNGMPVVVSGSSSLVDALADAEPDGLDVTTASSARDARRDVVERDAVAAIVVDGDTATVYTATGAGARQVTTITQLITPALMDAGLTIQGKDVAPLPDSDPAGLGAMFLATALVMAGYLPFSVLRSNSPELLKFRRIVPLIAGWAALIAALVWVVTGPILGVIDLKHTVAVLSIAWLGVFAIASVQLFITRLFGAMGVIIAMLFLMVLGMPSSNMAISVYTMPGFFQFTHTFLPMPAIGEAMRAVLYFDGVGLVPHLLVLAIGAVVGLGATKIYDTVQERRKPDAGPLSVNIPSLHGGRRPDSRFWRYLSLAAFPFAMVTMMITFMLGAMHQPTPHDMPVAVVGQNMDQAKEAVSGMEEQMGDMVDFTALDDRDAAEDMVESRELAGAVVLPSQNDPQFTIVGNQAGNISAFQMMTRMFEQVASAQDMPSTVEDVHPLPDRDSNGVVVMYLAMGWILAGFMIVIVGANAAPHTRPLRRMLPLTAIYAPFMSAVLVVIAGPMTGAVDGHYAALWGAGVLAIFCIALFAMIFERLIGMFAIIPVIGTLMFAGVPSSNAALSEYMAPPFFAVLHDYLPMPAAAEVIRSILYVDGDVVAEHLQVLALWGLISLAVVFIIDAIKPLRTEHDFGNMDPDLLPGASRRRAAAKAMAAKAEIASSSADDADANGADRQPALT